MGPQLACPRIVSRAPIPKFASYRGDLAAIPIGTSNSPHQDLTHPKLTITSLRSSPWACEKTPLMSFHANNIATGPVWRIPAGVKPAADRPPVAASLLPLLMVLHQETSTPGRVGNALRELGHKLDIRRPRFGDTLPETLEGHAGAVIFGGPMSANDGDEFVRREIDWVAVPLAEQRPFLGICLGAQMLARQLGARVAPHAQGREEIGYYPIRPTAAGTKLCPDWPDHVYHWHREGFELPHGAEL